MVNFLKYKFFYFLISLLVISTGVFSIVKWGYRYSIDFVGGTNLQYQLSNDIDLKKIKEIITSNKIETNDIEINNNVLSIKAKVIDEKAEAGFKKNLEDKLNVKIIVLRSETVGPILGKETMTKTLIASLLAVLEILIYMSLAFKGFNYAFSAVLAMIHAFLVVVGCYSLMSHFYKAELDTMFVTAVLTTMSFSVHDTIVIFDKIREYLRDEGRGNIEYYANKALTETMVRSLNNSMTIVFMLLALTLMGGATIKFFIITLLIGTITGTYSSPFIATPILVWLEKKKHKNI